MNLFVSIKFVLKILFAKKGRSFLTILGIMIGVAGVIIIIALGAGAKALVLGQVTKLGSNLLSVQPGKSNEKGPPAQMFGIVVTTLVNSDAQALRSTNQVPHASAVNANVLGKTTVTWRNKSIDTNFTATDAYYPKVVHVEMSAGRFFNAQENKSAANVAVLGSTVVKELFSHSAVNPIGQVIRVKSANSNIAGGVPLRVIGTVVSRGTAFFQDQDDQIIIPLKIGQQQLLGIHYLRTINIKVDSSANIQQTIQDIKNVLNRRHHIQTASEIDYTIRNMASAVALLSTITNALSLFLTAMAAISLLVGGIGIMNIMMATIGERTREVGLRKALGATNHTILKQFLLEAVILTTLGGLIGIIVGVLVSYGLFLLMIHLGYDWAFVISPLSIILAIGVSILSGVLFGLYPALKAARLDPIEALRYE